MTKILQNKCVLFTYGLINYYECLVIVLSMSRWNCLEVIVHHCIIVPCGLITEKYDIEKLLLHLIMSIDVCLIYRGDAVQVPCM